MEIEVLQDRLAKALNIVSRVAASTKAGLPILSNVLLRAEELVSGMFLPSGRFSTFASVKNGERPPRE